MYLHRICITFLGTLISSNYRRLFLSFLLLTTPVAGDSFQFNSYNNHGVVGLINMPTARFYNESAHGIILYDGTPDQ